MKFSGTTVLGLLITSLAGFTLAKHEFPGRGLIFALILATLAIPEYVTLIPSFGIVRALGILNTYWSVILPLSPHVLAVFLLRQYFRQLPDEIFDAGRIDGAGELRLFWTIAMPLIRPGLGATSLLLFLNSWNSYLLPLIMLRTPGMFTMPIGLDFLHSELSHGGLNYSPWSAITAGTVFSVVPLIICLAFMQRQFIAGLTGGAVKE